MPSNYKLLVTDVDGTLMANTSDISAENRAAITDAHRAGVSIAICTGRAIGSCRNIIDELGLQDSYHMFFDGALVSRIDDIEPVYAANLKPKVIRDMVAFTNRNGIDLELASARGLFVERETWSTILKREFYEVEVFIGSLEGICERERIIRACIAVRDEDDENQATHFIERFQREVQFIEAHSPQFPDVHFRNVVTLGLSKGKALVNLAAHLGIDRAEVMAVGDWLNDIPMITTAGLGVAMGNAHADVKSVADHITLNVEEHGLAEAIRKFLL